jgi:hypothetical protein
MPTTVNPWGKTVPESVLPERPSEILEVALRDLKTCMNSSKYNINMTQWLSPAEEGFPCEVCIAGAWIAQSSGVGTEETSCPVDFEHDTAEKLYMINHFREYSIGKALQSCPYYKRYHLKYRTEYPPDELVESLKAAWSPEMLSIDPYGDDQFFEAWETFIDKLKEHKL